MVLSSEPSKDSNSIKLRAAWWNKCENRIFIFKIHQKLQCSFRGKKNIYNIHRQQQAVETFLRQLIWISECLSLHPLCFVGANVGRIQDRTTLPELKLIHGLPKSTVSSTLSLCWFGHAYVTWLVLVCLTARVVWNKASGSRSSRVWSANRWWTGTWR